MKLKNTLLAVSDMDRSLEFYSKLLGLSVELDFGANKTLTGGLVLQTLDTWKAFLGTKAVSFGGNAAELYLEEEDFDAFLRKLDTCAVDFVHPPKEHSWGQRVVRFYDPDRHIIEVGEELGAVCRRFLASGMTAAQTAERMDVPLSYVEACMKS